MDPINYITQVQTPFQAALQGYQAGAAIRDSDFQGQQQQLQVQQQGLQMQAAQAAMQRQQAQHQVLQQLASNPNPTAADYANASLLTPDLKDHLKQAWDMRSAAQQQEQLQHMGGVYSALVAGSAGTAADMLRARADAARGSGDYASARAASTMADVIDAHPETARTMIGMNLAALPGGDKMISSVAAMNADKRAEQQAPADLAIKNATASKTGAEAVKTAAEASTAQVDAANAPTRVNLENNKKAQEIETERFNRELATLDMQIKQANSETTRGELQLKRDEMVQKYQQKQKEQGQAAQGQIDTINQTLDTLDKVRNHPGLGKGTGFGANWLSKISSSEAADFRAVVATLQSQQFMAGVAKLKASGGAGSLSDAEGNKIASAISSLDVDKQSPEQLRKSLDTIDQVLSHHHQTVLASGNAPTNGGAVLMTGPSGMVVREGDVNRFMIEHPGASRKQVLDFFKSKGAQMLPIEKRS